MKQPPRLAPRGRWSALLGLGLLALAGAPAHPTRVAYVTAAAGAQKAEAPLVEMNGLFRTAYAQARKELLAKQGPVILADGDSVVLMHAGRRTEVPVSAQADLVKPVAHAPLALNLLLVSAGEAELAPERLQQLRKLRALLEPAATALAGHGLPDDIRQLHTQILADTGRFLDEVLANKKVRSTERLAFTRKLGPLLQQSAAYAAATQLEALHKQIMAWKANMTPADWKQLRVVIPGSAPPRKDNLRTQYFARLLGETGESPRILYAEALFDEARALNLLGSYQLDTVIGTDFFADPNSLHRDLLADGAAAHLKKMRFE